MFEAGDVGYGCRAMDRNGCTERSERTVYITFKESIETSQSAIKDHAVQSAMMNERLRSEKNEVKGATSRQPNEVKS